MNLKTAFFILLISILLVGCAQVIKPPATFLRTFDEPGTWKSIEVREGLTKDQLWRLVVDALAQKFDMEVLDKESGYIRTSWKYTYVIEEKIIENYRSRIIIKFLGEAWNTLQVKSEANWMEKGGWILGYDTRLLEDVYGDIQGRIGRIRR